MTTPSAQAALQALDRLCWRSVPASDETADEALLRQFIEGAERDRVDAERYRWLRDRATPGERPAQDEWPLNYLPIRLRVETAAYLPSTWGHYVDRAVDAARSAEQKGKDE